MIKSVKKEMDNNNVVLNMANDKSRKIRSHSSKSHRANPYAKKRNVRAENQCDEDQGILGRVSNYIVPSWISSWWKKDKTEENAVLSESDESDENENNPQSSCSQSQILKSNDNHKIKPLSHEVTLTSNSIVQSTAVKPPLLGFYDKVGDNTLNRPSFLDNSFDSVQFSPSNQSFSNEKMVSEVSRLNSVIQKPTLVPKPAFNVSAFVSPNLSSHSFSTSNNTTLDLSAMNKSLFYSGQTKFGGSLTYRQDSIKRQRISPVSNHACTTLTQMKAKLLPYAKKNAVTSATAKKILSTLDNMSSPIKDSRKLPSMQHLISPLTFSQKLRDLSKKKDCNVIKPPVSTLETVKQSQKGFILSTNNTNTDQHQVVKPLKTIESFTFAKPGLSSAQEKVVSIDSKQSSDINTSKTYNYLSKKTGKLRREHSNHYSVPKSEEIINTLPNIANVSFSLPSIATFKSSFQSASPELLPKPFVSKDSEKVTSKDVFYFSEPCVLAVRNHSEDPKVQFYKFSEPITIKKQTQSEGFQPILINNEKDNIKRDIKFKTVKLPGSWECSVCLVHNKPDTVKCVACQNEKLAIVNAVNNSSLPQIKQLSSKFLKSENSWDCSTCLINNKSSSEKCVACETPKSKGVANEHSVAENTLKQESIKAFPVFSCSTQAPQIKALSLKFLKSESSWDCPTCLINNKTSSEKCIACETLKPKSIASASGDTSNIDMQSRNTNSSLTKSFPGSSIFTFGNPNHSTSQSNNTDISSLSTFTSKVDNFAKVPATLSDNVFPFSKSFPESNIFTFGKPNNSTTQNDKVPSFSFKTATNPDKVEKVSESTNFSSNVLPDSKSFSESSIFTFGKPNHSTASNSVDSPTRTFDSLSKVSENANLSQNASLLAKSLPESSIFTFGKPNASIAQNNDTTPSFSSITSSKADSFATVSSNVSTFAKSLPGSNIFTFGKPSNFQNSLPTILSITATNADSLVKINENKLSGNAIISEKSNSSAILNSVPRFTFGVVNNESKSHESSQLPNTTPLFSFGKITEKNVTPFQWGSNSANSIDAKSTENTVFGANLFPSKLLSEPSSITPVVSTNELQQPSIFSQPSIFGLSTTSATCVPSFNFGKAAELPFSFGSSNSVVVSKPSLTFGSTPSVFGSSESKNQNSAGFCFGNSASSSFSTVPSFNFSAGSKASFLSENPMPSFLPGTITTKPYDFSASNAPSFNFTSGQTPSFNFTNSDNILNSNDSKNSFLNGTNGLFSMGTVPSANDKRYKQRHRPRPK